MNQELTNVLDGFFNTVALLVFLVGLLWSIKFVLEIDFDTTEKGEFVVFYTWKRRRNYIILFKYK